MPSLKIIRKRITSVKSTQKITRAMKMVAGARLNRAQQRIVSMRAYAVKTGEILQSVAASMVQEAAGESNERDGALYDSEGGAMPRADEKDGPLHPLLAVRPEKKVLFVVFTSDRGLCGGFNANITKATEREWRAKKAAEAEVSFVTLGRKGREYLNRRSATIAHDFAKIYDGLSLESARLVSSYLVSHFQKKDYDAIYLVYNQFKSAITQQVVLEPLLPLRRAAPSNGALGRDGARADGAAAGAQATTEFLFEPNQKALLERLVPMYVEITIYRAMLESQASEFGARMTAMDAATRNAKEMISRLTLAYNRARQAAITKELMEIIGGAEALKE